MNTLTFIYLILTGYGLTNILVNSSLFFPIREKLKSINFLYQLINCMMCTGFWVGVLISLFILSPSNELFLLNYTIIPKTILNSITDGLFFSGMIWLIHTIQEKLER